MGAAAAAAALSVARTMRRREATTMILMPGEWCKEEDGFFPGGGRLGGGERVAMLKVYTREGRSCIVMILAERLARVFDDMLCACWRCRVNSYD